MARDASGTYTRVSNSFTQPVASTTISPTDADAFWDELETEMTDSLSRTGKGGMSADLDMNNNDINEIKTAVFQGSTSGNTTVIATAIAGTTTLTLPAATDTLVGKATTDTLTNKTFDTAGTGNSFSINGTAITAVTGTGSAVLATSPTLVTPTLGVATATTYNKVTITAPASAATLTLIDGTTLTGPAASGTVMTLGNTETVTGVKTFGSAGAVGRLKIAGTTSGAVTLDATAVAGTGTLTLPNATDTLVGKATVDTLTNKTFDTAAPGNVLQVASVTVSRGQYVGTNTNDSATAGNIGEFISSTVLSGSAVSLTTATAANVTSISLTAGDWDVSGLVDAIVGGTTDITQFLGWISTTSATLPTIPNGGAFTGSNWLATHHVGFNDHLPVGTTRLSLSSTTTVYLSVRMTFTVSTAAAYGFIGARRVR